MHSFSACAGLLAPGGAYVTTLPDFSVVIGTIRALFSSKRCCFVQVKSRAADLEFVGGWLSDGLDVTIDSTHPVSDLNAALARPEDRACTGRVVVTVDAGRG